MVPLAWAAIAAFVLSPFAVLAVGGLPPDKWWQLACWGGLFVLAIVAVVRARRFWPACALVCALPAWILAVAAAMELYYPCWRHSNAEWCGHFCEEDACACAGRTGYGSGKGCPD